jgi:hypothetical protein
MIIEVGAYCPVELAFLLGWCAGIFLVFLGAWVLLYSYRDSLKKYYIHQDDVTKQEIIGRLQRIVEELEILEKKSNTKYLRWRLHGFIDLIVFLRKRKLE